MAPGFWVFATAALFIAAALGALVGRLVEKRRGDAALRSARQALGVETGLRHDWSWQTDEHHALQWLRPPAGADSAAWQAAAAPGEPPWTVFDSPGLRQRIEARAAFTDLHVRRRDDGSRWLLGALPRSDDAGRFAGHAGSARPAGDGGAAVAALRMLLGALDGVDAPALLAADDGRGWQLGEANAAMRRLLEGTGGDWSAIEKRLPPAVREAIAGSADSADADGWLLRRHDSDGGRGLVLLQPPQATAGDAGESEAASFSFTVSHDLRAPIRVVEGFTRILKEDYGPRLDRVGNDHLDRVLGAAARMNSMIDALLTLARLSQQPLALQPVNLSQLAGYVIDELRRGAPERDADIRIEPAMQTRGDPTLLRLVLENLLGNAWKYSAKAKRTLIVFGREQVDGERTYVVRDNGAGFDMRSAERLFGLFQRLHSATEFPGSGVGLASVKRIVRRHGGDIWADAEPGRGAAFHFTLRE